MTINGATIYSDGVGIGHASEEKIRQIVNAVKSLSPSAEVSMRFLKSGRSYEALLWGKTENIPIGVYNRGPSMSHVLDTLHRKVKMQCLKARKFGGLRCQPNGIHQTSSQSSFAAAA